MSIWNQSGKPWICKTIFI